MRVAIEGCPLRENRIGRGLLRAPALHLAGIEVKSTRSGRGKAKMVSCCGGKVKAHRREASHFYVSREVNERKVSIECENFTRRAIPARGETKAPKTLVQAPIPSGRRPDRARAGGGRE